MSKTSHDDALPVTVPDASTMPITLYDGGAALRMAVAERDGVQAPAGDWDRPGVYLMSPTGRGAATSGRPPRRACATGADLGAVEPERRVPLDE